MGLKDIFRRQLSTVIEWTNQSANILIAKAGTPTDEIKNASKLIIAPGQGCIVVYEGKIEAVTTDAGVYTLETDNHPFITTLIKMRQMFESEHKMRIYFFRTAELLNQRWGTASPVKYMDSVYKFPVEMSGYGNYSVKLADAQHFFSNLIGSKDLFTATDLQEIVVARLIPQMGSYLGQSKFSIVEIDAHLTQISDEMKGKMQPTFAELGLVLTDFRIEATSFDEESTERINRIAGMTAEALSAAEVGLDYVQLEKLRALRDAAKNEGGIAGAGMQLGVGLELGKTLLSGKDNVITGSADKDPVEQLKNLKMLLDEGILTQEEFDAKKKELLEKM